MDGPKMVSIDDVRDTMIALTQHVVPYGYEERVYGEWLGRLGMHYVSGVGWFLGIGESRTIFCAHLDSADSDFEPVQHTLSADGRWLGTDGKTILSADDKAGVCVLLNMIANKIPGQYWFFVGEEVGRLGSERLVAHGSEYYDATSVDRVICFDRKGYTDIITEQSCGESASGKFAAALSSELARYHIHTDPNGAVGSYTDSASFAYEIPECTNISIGYFHAHTVRETQDLSFLTDMCNAAVRVDWESLPVGKEPLERSRLQLGFGSLYYGGPYYDLRNESPLLPPEHEQGSSMIEVSMMEVDAVHAIVNAALDMAAESGDDSYGDHIVDILAYAHDVGYDENGASLYSMGLSQMVSEVFDLIGECEELGNWRQLTEDIWGMPIHPDTARLLADARVAVGEVKDVDSGTDGIVPDDVPF